MTDNCIKIKVYAELREKIGNKILKIPIQGYSTLMDILQKEALNYPVFSDIIRQINTKYQIYLNGDLINSLSKEVKPDDELVILPPVGGG